MVESYIKCLLAKSELGIVTKKSVEKIKSMLEEVGAAKLDKNQKELAEYALQSLEERLVIKAENAVRHANLVNEGAKRLSLIKTQDDVLPVLSSFGMFDEAHNIKYGFMGKSANTAVEINRNFWLAKLDDAFEALKDDQKFMFFDPKTQNQIIASIFDQTRGTSFKGHTNAEADAIAKMIVETTMQGAKAAREAGQFVSTRVDHSIGRHPVRDKIIAAGKQSYIEDSIAATDMKLVSEATGGYIADEKTLAKYFDHEWDNINSGGVIDMPDFIPKGAKSVVNTRNHSRIIHFKDADSYIDWHSKYGTPTLLEQLSNYASTLGKDIGILETYGPQPQAFIRSMFRIAGEKGFTVDKPMQDTIFRHFMATSGQWDRALSPSIERSLNTFRALSSASMLGSTTIAAIVDSTALPAVANSMRGLPILRTMARNLKTFVSPGAVKADIRTLQKIGVLNEYFLNETAGQLKALDIDVGSKFAIKAASTVHKISLLTRLTNATKTTAVMELAMDLAETPFVNLGKDLQTWLGKFGIDQQVLEVMQKHGLESVGRKSDVMVLSPFKLREAGFKEEATKLGTLLTQRQEIASPTTSAKMNAYWSQLARNGKGSQIFVGSAKTFTGYMASFYNNILRPLYTSTTPLSKVTRTAKLLTALGIGGSVVTMLNDLKNGKSPTLDARTVLRGFGQTLAIPVIADYLLNDSQIYGQSPFARTQGVAISAAGDLLGAAKSLVYGEPVDAAKKAVKLATQFIPGQSLWWASLVLKRELFDQLRYLYDPKADQYFNRQIRQAQKDNTPFWWKPGKTEPDELPNLDNIFNPDKFMNLKRKK